MRTKKNLAKYNMEAPRTSSGKPCKLCLKKGAKCHIHTGSSPKKSSAKKKRSSVASKKSTKKRGTSPKMILDDIPLPALQQILLNMERKELHDFCSKNKQAFKICKEKNFQMMYEAKHGTTGQMIVGKLKLESVHTEAMSDWFFEDEIGDRLIFDLRGPGDIMIGYSTMKRQGLDRSKRFLLTYEKKSRYDNPTFFLRTYRGHPEVLETIGKLRWLKKSKKPTYDGPPGFEDVDLSRDAAEEFLALVKKAVEGQVPDIFFKKTKGVNLISRH
jgi:hypothetical protein